MPERSNNEDNKENVFIPNNEKNEEKKSEVDSKNKPTVYTHHVPDQGIDREGSKSLPVDKEDKKTDGKEKVDPKELDTIQYLTMGDKALHQELTKEFLNQLDQKAKNLSSTQVKNSILTLYHEVFPNPKKNDLSEIWSKIMEGNHVKFEVKKAAKTLLNESMQSLVEKNPGDKKFSDIQARWKELKVDASDSKLHSKADTKSKETNGLDRAFKM